MNQIETWFGILTCQALRRGTFDSVKALVAMSGTAPIPASSGQTNRHRLNRGGNRQLNRALHTMALVQARSDPRAQAYMAKRMSEGKSRLEALRCLKRHLANVVMRTMLADANRPPEVDAEDNIELIIVA